MISMQNVAVTASFMATGMMDVDERYRTFDEDKTLLRNVYIAWGNGGIELHIELCEYAELSEKIVDFITRVMDIDFPGVYDYEVSEPFGMWFAEHIFKHNKGPNKNEGKKHLIEQACQFFSMSHSVKAPDCVKLVKQVTVELS